MLHAYQYKKLLIQGLKIINYPFQKMREMITTSFITLEVLKGESHLEEVESKRFHEEEEGKKSREYATNIGQHINQGEIPPVNSLGDRGPFDPEISSSRESIGNISSWFERLR